MGRAQLQRPFRVGGMELTIVASAGVALGPDHSTSGEELLQLADLAMYSAKSFHKQRAPEEKAARPADVGTGDLASTAIN